MPAFSPTLHRYYRPLRYLSVPDSLFSLLLLAMAVSANYCSARLFFSERSLHPVRWPTNGMMHRYNTMDDATPPQLCNPLYKGGEAYTPQLARDNPVVSTFWAILSTPPVLRIC
ncbi:hypothetical protein K440DRAFT_634358 [Wilcoxina mikolae CBS 423.85]|nr:hypothetical protein K440DRAFT_634358 [Wilcoxina mikolae CBS 423.85]